MKPGRLSLRWSPHRRLRVGPRWRLVALAAGLSAGSMTGRAFAQEEGYPVQAIAVPEVSGEVFANGRYRQDQETRGRSQSQVNETDLLMRQGVDLHLGGYVYHPNLVDWNANLRLGLIEQQTKINEETRDSFGNLLGYNLSALFFKEKPFPMRAFATYDDQFIDRAFARNIRLKTQSEGAEFYYHGDTPAALLLEHRTSLEESDLRIEDEETYTARFSLEDRRDRDWFTRLVLLHEQTEETDTFLSDFGGPTIVQDLPDQRDELNLTNNWLFGPEELPNRLTGNVRMLRREGFFNNTVYVFDQQLVLAHTPTFSTFYHGTFDSDETDDQSDRTVRGEVGFIKKVYESLNITGRTFVRNRELTDGSEEEYAAFLDLDYRKKTPIGIYTSTLNLGMQQEQDQFEGGQRRVLDEQITLAGISRVPLNLPNITAGSIRVTDITNTKTYVEGIDYLVRRTGTITEIERLAGGSIASGEAVLVDYTSTTAQDYQFRTQTITWHNRLAFDPWPVAVYGMVRLRDETLTAGDDPGNLDREESFLGGAELTPGPFHLAAEYEQRTHTLYPSWSAYRGRANYTQNFGGASQVNVGANYQMLTYTNGPQFDLGPGRDFLETYGAFANLDTRINKNLLLRLENSYYKTTGRDNDVLARVGASLLWQYGNLKVDLSTYYEIFEQEQDEGNSIFFGFNVVRSF